MTTKCNEINYVSKLKIKTILKYFGQEPQDKGSL